MPHPLAPIPKNPDGTLRVLILGRISTPYQNESNIQAGYEYARTRLQQIYSGPIHAKEIGARESGMLVERETILEAYEEIDSGCWDLVLMEDCSKSYRNPRWMMAFVQDCVDTEVRVIAPGDNLDTAEENWELMLGAAAFRHGLHIPDTRRRIRRSADHTFERGGMVMKVKYGYRRLNKKEAASGQFGPVGLRMVRCEDATPVITEMAARVLDGAPLSAIADWLMDEQIETGPYVKGGWTARVVRDLLRDPILVGVRHHRKVVHRPIFKTGKHRRERNPEPRKKYEPSLRHLSDEMFEALQEELARRGEGQPALRDRENPRYRIPRSNARFPFQHARCGVCGALMYGSPRGNMRCSSAKNSLAKKCWNHVQASVAQVRERILSWILTQVPRSSAFHAAIIDAVWSEYKQRRRSGNRRAESMKRQLADIKEQLANITSAIAKMGDSEALMSQLDQLEAQQRNLRSELSAQESSPSCTSRLSSREEVAEHLEMAIMDLASTSYAFGEVMRRLLVRFDIIPVRRCDKNYVRPRARLTLRIPTTPDGNSSEDIHHEIDLFDPPAEIVHLDDCIALKAEEPVLTLRQMGERLGINYMSVKRALAVSREMQEQQLQSPYVELTARPESAARWKG